MTDCPKRQELLQITAAGERLKIARCAEPRAQTHMQTVDDDVCAACPVRTLLVKEEKKKSAPKVKFTDIHPVRSVRQDKDPPARWLECRYRKVVLMTKCCGNPALARVCDCLNSRFYGQKIDAINCHGCPHRQPFLTSESEMEDK